MFASKNRKRNNVLPRLVGSAARGGTTCAATFAETPEPASKAPRRFMTAAMMTACRIERAPAPIGMPIELATSLPPTAKRVPKVQREPMARMTVGTTSDIVVIVVEEGGATLG